MSERDFPQFPADFLFGAATASYQIEGAAREDNRGESTWDRFSHTPGNVYNGHTGDVACDHYHRWQEDVALMTELGLKAYRFSIAWPRVIPDGTGPTNPKGLDFYDRLVDALLNKGIEPFVPLYHWDLPVTLEEVGGWCNRDLVGYFANYTEAVVRRLGDRVRFWTTFNEPWVFTYLGYYYGNFPPGINDLTGATQAAHHTLVAHGAAADIIRAHAGPKAQVGITLNLSPVDPATERPEDIAAAKRHDGFLNRWFLDGLFRGQYPGDMVKVMHGDQIETKPGDLAGLAKRIDFLGINNYSRTVVRHKEEGFPFDYEVVKPKGAEYTEMNWEVYPEGLYRILTRVYEDYQPSVMYVTENGAAFDHTVDENGEVNDPRRVAYYRDYIDAAHRALKEGVPLKGYFAWSLLDNFEWAHGYSKRFGIIYVDYLTQGRTIKESGYWYRDLIAAQE